MSSSLCRTHACAIPIREVAAAGKRSRRQFARTNAALPDIKRINSRIHRMELFTHSPLRHRAYTEEAEESTYDIQTCNLGRYGSGGTKIELKELELKAKRIDACLLGREGEEEWIQRMGTPSPLHIRNRYNRIYIAVRRFKQGPLGVKSPNLV